MRTSLWLLVALLGTACDSTDPSDPSDAAITADQAFAADQDVPLDDMHVADMSVDPDMGADLDMQVEADAEPMDPDMELVADDMRMAQPADMMVPTSIRIGVLHRSSRARANTKLQVRYQGEVVSQEALREGQAALSISAPIGVQITFEIWHRDTGVIAEESIILQPTATWVLLIGDGEDDSVVLHPIWTPIEPVPADERRVNVAIARADVPSAELYDYNQPNEPSRLAELRAFVNNHNIQGAQDFTRMGLDTDSDEIPEFEFVLPTMPAGAAWLITIETHSWCIWSTFEQPVNLACGPYLPPVTGPHVEFVNAVDAGPDGFLTTDQLALWAIVREAQWPLRDLTVGTWSERFRVRRNGYDLTTFDGARNADGPLSSAPYYPQGGDRFLTVFTRPSADFRREGEQIRVQTVVYPEPMPNAWHILRIHGTEAPGSYWFARVPGQPWELLPGAASDEVPPHQPWRATLRPGQIELAISLDGPEAPTHSFGVFESEVNLSALLILQREGDTLQLLWGEGPGPLTVVPAQLLE